LLVAQGIRLQVRGDFLQRLDQLTLWDGKGLAAELRDELAREYARYELGQRQIRELESRRRARLKSPGTAAERQVVQLMELGAIGPSVNAEVIFPRCAEVKFPSFSGDQAVGWIFSR